MKLLNSSLKQCALGRQKQIINEFGVEIGISLSITNGFVLRNIFVLPKDIDCDVGSAGHSGKKDKDKNIQHKQKR